MMAAQTTHAGMRLGELLHGIASVPAGIDVLITGITLDSRKVRPGDLFLACPGHKSDGRFFIPQAWRTGAAAIAIQADQVPETISHQGMAVIAIPELIQLAGSLASRFYGEPSRAMQLAGVTGTNGKTSVAWYLAQSLSGDNSPCGLLGTLGYGIYDEPLAPAVNDYAGSDQPCTHGWPDGGSSMCVTSGRGSVFACARTAPGQRRRVPVRQSLRI
jgi:UDP-N-acetylmuramoyl-L-alanyl-D-glutamate--2,6-diaminopimelate ligase